MKKVKNEMDDWLRDEYTRADLGTLVRGKYAKRMAAESNVVVIDPAVAKVFPNEKAVNTALRGLIDLAQAAARPARSRTKLARAG